MAAHKKVTEDHSLHLPYTLVIRRGARKMALREQCINAIAYKMVEFGSVLSLYLPHTIETIIRAIYR